MSKKYDLAILGGGPGGYVAALRAANLGLSVALIDEGGIGGTCLQRGCIPTKALLSSAKLYSGLKNAQDFGVHCKELSFDMAEAVARKDKVVYELVSGIEKILKKRKVEVIKGRGCLSDSRTILVDTLEDAVKADKIIIATGSRPAKIPSLEVDGRIVLNSDQALEQRTLPSSMLIVGGGVIGCEFATFYSMLGVDVTIVELMDRVLMASDKVLAKQAAASMKKKGVKILCKTKIEKLITKSARAVATLESGDEIDFDQALVSIGRVPCTEDIGLSSIGLELDERGFIPVDKQQRTSLDGIFAIGDVISGTWWLAHAASAQGVVAAEIAAGLDSQFADEALPSVTFTNPELAQVGLTEAQCREREIPFKTGRFMFAANGKALAQGEGSGTVKLIVEKDGNKVLGCHILGPGASDLISEVTHSMRVGSGAEGIVKTIHAHPTLSEVIHEAAEAALGNPIHQI